MIRLSCGTTPRRQHVALEHLGIAAERSPRPPGCARRRESFRPITGAPTFIAMSMILQIFCACRSRQRAAEHGEVLAEDEHQPAVDRARSGDDAVAGDTPDPACRNRRNYARRTCRAPRTSPRRAARRAARARSACPWRAARRCASRPPPSARRGAPAFQFGDRRRHGPLPTLSCVLPAPAANVNLRSCESCNCANFAKTSGLPTLSR